MGEGLPQLVLPIELERSEERPTSLGGRMVVEELARVPPSALEIGPARLHATTSTLQSRFLGDREKLTSQVRRGKYVAISRTPRGTHGHPVATSEVAGGRTYGGPN